MDQPSNSESTSSLPIRIEVRVVIFSLRSNRLQTLLVAAAGDKAGGWSIPGLPAVPGSSLEKTANRCLAEFTGRRENYLEQLYTYGDPARGGGACCISVVYFALVPAGAFSLDAGDRAEAAWHPLDNLPPTVTDHKEILAYALRRLRYKLEYSAVGFELLPENFSLSELQQTYEIILGETLDKRNFRRRILQANVIEPTPHQRSGEGRPARLYRYRPDAVAEVKVRRLFP